MINAHCCPCCTIFEVSSFDAADWHHEQNIIAPVNTSHQFTGGAIEVDTSLDCGDGPYDDTICEWPVGVNGAHTVRHFFIYKGRQFIATDKCPFAQVGVDLDVLLSKTDATYGRTGLIGLAWREVDDQGTPIGSVDYDPLNGVAIGHEAEYTRYFQGSKNTSETNGYWQLGFYYEHFEDDHAVCGLTSVGGEAGNKTMDLSRIQFHVGGDCESVEQPNPAGTDYNYRMKPVGLAPGQHCDPNPNDMERVFNWETSFRVWASNDHFNGRRYFLTDASIAAGLQVGDQTTVVAETDMNWGNVYANDGPAGGPPCNIFTHCAAHPSTMTVELVSRYS